MNGRQCLVAKFFTTVGVSLACRRLEWDYLSVAEFQQLKKQREICSFRNTCLYNSCISYRWSTVKGKRMFLEEITQISFCYRTWALKKHNILNIFIKNKLVSKSPIYNRKIGFNTYATEGKSNQWGKTTLQA